MGVQNIYSRIKILSGADIGGSCYLLELYSTRILFDCGIRVGSAYTDHPDIPSPETIDAIFVSHAHLDHMGAIAYTAAVCKNAKIYMTEQTKEFVRYQLAATIAEYIGAETDDLRFHNRILCELIMNRIQTIQYREKVCFQTLNGQKCYFSLFHAGHVPGAAMVYMQIRDKTVLYTGDFAAYDTSLTYPYSLPSGIKPEIMILCGTHANNPDYEVYSQNALSNVVNRMYDALSRNSKFVIPVSQLTKGLEILAMLEDMISIHEFPKSQIYLEPNLWELARYYERTSETFRLPDYIRPLSEWRNNNRPVNPIIVFEHTGCDMTQYPNHTRVNADFTLHADYQDLIDFIYEVNPSQVYIVHAAEGEGSLHKETLNPNLKRMIYTENQAVYEII